MKLGQFTRKRSRNRTVPSTDRASSRKHQPYLNFSGDETIQCRIELLKLLLQGVDSPTVSITHYLLGYPLQARVKIYFAPWFWWHHGWWLSLKLTFLLPSIDVAIEMWTFWKLWTFWKIVDILKNCGHSEMWTFSNVDILKIVEILKWWHFENCGHSGILRF